MCAAVSSRRTQITWCSGAATAASCVRHTSARQLQQQPVHSRAQPSIRRTSSSTVKLVISCSSFDSARSS
eukprot:15748-Heterococcus_DN1.PRE.2